MSAPTHPSVFATAEAAEEAARLRLLREQFAIHAPACPDWFQAEMGRQRPGIPGPPDWLSSAACALALDWKNDPASYSLAEEADQFGHDITQEEREWLCLYETAVTDSIRARRVYDEETRVRRLAQWPWAWADAVLAERGER